MLEETIRAQGQHVRRRLDGHPGLVERQIEDAPGTTVSTRRPRLRPKRDHFGRLSRLDGPRKDILDLRPIADDQPIRIAAAVRQVVQLDEVIAILRGDEIDQRIAAVVIAIGDERLAGRVGQRQRRVHLRIELARLALDDDALPLLRREAEDILPIAVAGAVDRRVDGDDLRRRDIGRPLEGDIGEAVRHAEQARVTDAEAADEADIVGAGRTRRRRW